MQIEPTFEFAYDENLVTRTVEKDGKSCTEILVVSDPHNVTDEFLKQAKTEKDQYERPCIRFSLNETGGERFGKLTGENQPDAVTGARRRLAIILDGKLYSAPSIMSRITTDGIIHGSFTEQEATEIANVLNSGSLPTPLKQVSSESIMMNETPTKPGKAEPSPEPATKPDTTQPAPVKPTISTDKPQDDTYRIEPPDIVRIEAIYDGHLGPHKLHTGDKFKIYVLGDPMDAPVPGWIFVDAEKMINLGPDYGKVKVGGMTVEEATQAILKHLETKLDHPKVSLEAELMLAPQVTGSYLVGPDGKVTLKEYGSVNLNGMTVREAQRAVKKQLSKHLTNLAVTVTVEAKTSKDFYLIDGTDLLFEKVESLPATGKETVLETLQKFQGWGDLSEASIRLVRPIKGEPEKTLPVDYEAIKSGRDMKTNYQILPGDRLYVEAPKTEKE